MQTKSGNSGVNMGQEANLPDVRHHASDTHWQYTSEKPRAKVFHHDRALNHC